MENIVIPLLGKDDIDCRVQSVKLFKNKGIYASILLYKDARVDMRILDQVFGNSNWQRSHEVINGNLFCNIDIWDNEKKSWIRKQDVGIESNTQKEKGQASDSFKRAGFNVGIGRELYTAPPIRFVLGSNEYDVEQQGTKTIYKCKQWIKFKVSDIAYNDKREICKLVIIDENGNIRFDMNKKLNDNSALLPNKTETPIQNNAPHQVSQRCASPQNNNVCPKCGGTISDAERKYSLNRYGSEMCRTCQQQMR